MTKLVGPFIFCFLITSCLCKHIFVINSYAGEADDELLSVAVLYRHGDRTPISSYPTDPYYDISYWPEGYGELVNKGKERQYELGKWFRERYSTFLPAEYSSKDIRVISTDVDRALMSAAANLAGLYPPPDSQVWNKDLSWEPIPIHSSPTSKDEILAMERDCPNYNALYVEAESSDYIKNITVEYADLFEFITKHTGRNSTLGDIANLYSVFYVYKNHNESYIPTWAADIDEEAFSYLTGLHFKLNTFTDEMKRLYVGPFFNYLTSYFNDVVQNTTDTPKFLMLSAHDTTIASILNGMGAYDYWPPEFAATIIWELRRSKKGAHYINLLYKKNSTDILEELVVNNCTFDCEYDDFKLHLESVTVNTTTWLQECTSSAVQLKLYSSLPFFLIIYYMGIKFILL